MIRTIFKYLFHFAFILMLQIFVLDNISIFHLFHPYIYLLLILFLPTSIAPVFLLFIGFGTGFVIDIFSNTYGLHAASATLVAALRYPVIRFVMAENVPESSFEPHLKTMGFNRYLIYALILTGVHLVTLYFLQSFGFGNFSYFLMKTIFTTLISIAVIFVYEILVFLGQIKE